MEQKTNNSRLVSEIILADNKIPQVATKQGSGKQHKKKQKQIEGFSDI